MTVGNVPSAMPNAAAIRSGRKSAVSLAISPRAKRNPTTATKTVTESVCAGVRRVTWDARWSFVVAAQPQSLDEWLAAQTPAAKRVPADHLGLRVAWRVDNWTTGAPLMALSVCLYLAAGLCRYLAGHPARRWAFLLLTVVAATGIYLASTN